MRLADLRRTPGPAAALALLVALTLSGCSIPGFGPDPDDALGDFAAAVSKGKLTGVEIAGGADATKQAATSYAEITAGMDGDATVSAGDVSTDGDDATGKLAWKWQVGEETWSYDTTVKLTKGETTEATAGWSAGAPPWWSRR